MFVLNDDLSIYATRGDIIFFSVTAEDDGVAHTFKAGDVVRIKVYGKKKAEDVVLQKDFPVTADTESVEIFLNEDDTKIDEVISKPKDYWYEVELNPDSNPQTIIGYDEDGAKVFKLYPEGDDIPPYEPIKPEDIPIVDDELDLTSTRPVENQAVSRAIVSLSAEFEETKAEVNKKMEDTDAKADSVAADLSVEKARIDTIINTEDTIISQPLEWVEGISPALKNKIDGSIKSDGAFATITINLREANLFYGGTEVPVFIIPYEARPIDIGAIHTEDDIGYIVRYGQHAPNTYELCLSVSNVVTVAPSSAGVVTIRYATDKHELKDIRVGADGVTYDSAGTAVREQFNFVKDEINGLKEDVAFDIVSGTITSGIEDSHANRARFVQKIKARRAVVAIPKNSDYLYGYITYGEDGVYDGVDHGWNTMDGIPLVIDGGYFKMNFRKVVDGEMTESDFEALKSMLTIKQYNILLDVEDMKEQLNDGTPTVSTYEVELGSLSAGEKTDFTTRARFVEKVKVGEKTVATIAESQKYLYGYCVYDEDGVYDGVDHGWNSPNDKPEIAFEKNGYVMFNFRRTDAGDITQEDLAFFPDFVTIVSRMSLNDLAIEVKTLSEKVGETPDKTDGLTSVSVEYGRKYGASYVFARIPKTTNSGKRLKPKLHLTSVDGSIEGAKCSALSFAKRNDSIFTINAGLFNTATLTPVGQTVIDGVSVVNVPMTDDMGAPISDQECYPLCIDAEGNLSAPYGRDVDTAEMIGDGVVNAVTGWGKIIDDFKPCADTVENEIVHSETYIRQVIGQFQNGDYFVCTVDKARGSIENEAGMTYADLAQLLVDKGVKFAYSLDGGGSAETVLGLRQLNPIFEGTVGRSVPTVIAFEY